MPTMRLKKQDGTWDKVPVLGSYQAVLAANEAATNAQNAATHAEVQADSVKKYKVLWFDSVAAMKAEPSLTAGAYVCTAGYYEPNDGGGAYYVIKSNSTFFKEILNNDLVAELIIDDVLNMKKIGAKGDDSSFNNSQLLKEAIDIGLSSKKYSTIYFPSGYYYFTNTIDLLSENKALNTINIIGDGENFANAGNGTILGYYGADNTYFFNFGTVSRCLFQKILFAGSARNKCFCIKNCFVTRFEDIQFNDFVNCVWLQEYCGYVYFDHCMFNCSVNGAQGLVINKHYTDGRPFTQKLNTEYIYVTDCAFDGGQYANCNHIVCYGGHFLWISRCDLCNCGDTSILLDGSGWASNFLDIFISDISFCRNKVATKIITGTGQYGRISISGSWTRIEGGSTDDRILLTEGTKTIYGVQLAGKCEPYNSARYGIYAPNGIIKNTIYGEHGSVHAHRHYINYSYDSSSITPVTLRKIVPTVTVSGNTVTYDFSAYLPDYKGHKIIGEGQIGGVSGVGYIYFEFVYAYSSKLVTYIGANVAQPTVSGKTISIICSSAPTTDITQMQFYFI